jgi:exopolyphosphatase/guanosine-5'-triphosphate,3'-diphosphate pyrophosphatase
LTQLFDTSGEVSPSRLRKLRDFTRARLLETLPASLASAPYTALGSSGTIRAIVGFAASEGSPHATREQLSSAAETLARMPPAPRREHFDPRRADIIVAGAVLLEQVVHHLGVKSLTAVKQGLREGVLVDLWSRQDGAPLDEAPLLGGRHVLKREARAVGFN